MSDVGEALRAQAKVLLALADKLDAPSQTPTAPPESDIIGCAEAAKILCMHPKRVAQRAARGEIPGYHLPNVRAWRFRRSELVEWFDKNGKKGKAA